MPAGKYKINYYELKTFDDKFAGRTAQDVLTLATTKDFYRILKYYKSKGLKPKDLNDGLKHKVFVSCVNLDKANYSVRVSVDRQDIEGTYKVINASIYSIPNLEELRWYTKDDQDEILQVYYDILDDLLDEVYDYVKDGYSSKSFTKTFYSINFNFDQKYLFRKFDLTSKYNKILKLLKPIEKRNPSTVQYKSAQEAWDAYNQINSLGNIQKMESIKDPVARYQAFEQYKADILNAIKQIGRH